MVNEHDFFEDFDFWGESTENDKNFVDNSTKKEIELLKKKK